jgi:hypothetical protein
MGTFRSLFEISLTSFKISISFASISELPWMCVLRARHPAAELYIIIPVYSLNKNLPYRRVFQKKFPYLDEVLTLYTPQKIHTTSCFIESLKLHLILSNAKLCRTETNQNKICVLNFNAMS